MKNTKSPEEKWFESYDKKQNKDKGGLWYALGTWGLIFFITLLHIYFGKS